MPTLQSDSLLRFSRLLVVALAILHGAAALAEGWPRTIAHDGGSLILDTPPVRIVSTSPSLTGTLLAIDAPVVSTAAAVQGPLTDDSGFFRQWADIARARGLDVLYPNLSFDIEALIVADPDLVIVSETGGDSALAFVPEIEALGFPVLVLNYGVNSWEQLATTLGQATGHEDDAAAIIDVFAERAAEARARARIPDQEGTASIVSYNFFGTYGISKPEGVQARVLADMGFTVTGVPEGMQGMIQQSREFDFLSHENLPAAVTGDTVFLLAADETDVRAFLNDPVLANLPAVRSGRVYPLGKTSFRIDYYSGLAMIDAVEAEFAH